MRHRSTSIVAGMGLLAAIFGITGFSLDSSPVYGIVDFLYTSGAWKFFSKINYNLRAVLIVVFLILPHFVYAVSCIGLLFLRRWATWGVVISAPISTILTILGIFLAKAKLGAFAYLADLYVFICLILILSFFKTSLKSP